MHHWELAITHKNSTVPMMQYGTLIEFYALCDFKQRSVTQTLTVPVVYAVAVEAERMVRMYTC